jgi:2-polyprenyl-6-methoxyphenol hydroxylase-like FAD-dependent oxidoreductase
MASQPDVLIVGGGVAGATAATLLSRQGVQVTVVDRWAKYPECFKAEKIESDQADLFRKFGLMDTLLPHTGAVREILRAQDGQVIRKLTTEQYGIFYHDMVNALRGVMPAEVEFKVSRVEGMETGPERQTVRLSTGEVYQPRLVVLASGVGADLSQRLNLQRTVIQREQCFAAGFNINRVDGQPFDFSSITYFPTGSEARIAYLTLFPIGKLMRANLFACWSMHEERTREFVRQPDQELAHWLPQVNEVAGQFTVSSKVETARIDLFETAPPAAPGVVLIADAFQSVCPITGTGLSKVLTDVDVLCHECMPAWLASPGMEAGKLASFYQNARKREVDQHSLAGADYARRITMDTSLGWRLRRVHRRWENQMGGVLDHFRFTKNAMA